MPPPSLWCFFHCTEDRCIYIKTKDDVKKSYGAVLDVWDNTDKPNCIKGRGMAVYLVHSL